MIKCVDMRILLKKKNRTWFSPFKSHVWIFYELCILCWEVSSLWRIFISSSGIRVSSCFIEAVEVFGILNGMLIDSANMWGLLNSWIFLFNMFILVFGRKWKTIEVNISVLIMLCFCNRMTDIADNEVLSFILIKDWKQFYFNFKLKQTHWIKIYLD